MSKSSEAGYAKMVSNFEELISYGVALGDRYQPYPPELALAVLGQQHAAAVLLLEKLAKAERDWKDVINGRKRLFDQLKALVTRIIGALRTAGAPKETMTNAKSITRKIRGVRLEPKRSKKEDPSPVGPAIKLPGEIVEMETEEDNTISVSQQSFAELVMHFTEMIELLMKETKYVPFEEDLKVSFLVTMRNSMKVFNKEAGLVEAAHHRAIVAKDRALYAEETGIYTIAGRVKGYVMSVYGYLSPESRKVNRLLFKNRSVK